LEQHRFGWLGVAVPAVGQGTWHLERDSRSVAVAALRRGLDLGLSHIDTAELYGSGRVEERVAEAIEGRRAEVFLVSKVLPSNASSGGTIQACERTLRRLRTDHLDLYLLHWPGEYPLAETIGAFERLVKDGKIRAWGLSNFDVDELEQARAIAGEKRIACNQVLYHLQERSIEHAVLPWCQQHEVAVVGYSPFGSGQFPDGTTRGGRALREIAEARGTSPRQVALRFLIEKGTFAIPKASQSKHVEDNAGAGGFRLSTDETVRIEAAFPLGRPRTALPVL
jgi:diketogulonate reductase-like aldo/keto reductase